VSRATIYRWKKTRREKGGLLSALIPGSHAPKNKRLRDIPKEPETFTHFYGGSR